MSSKLADALVAYANTELDQWEHFVIDTDHGPVYIDIGRHPLPKATYTRLTPLPPPPPPPSQIIWLRPSKHHAVMHAYHRGPGTGDTSFCGVELTSDGGPSIRSYCRRCIKVTGVDPDD